MEDTKKTVLAGNGEKDVPRAVYDGVLTIDVDAQVESMEEQEEARWHQLLNAHLPSTPGPETWPGSGW